MYMIHEPQLVHYFMGFFSFCCCCSCCIVYITLKVIVLSEIFQALDYTPTRNRLDERVINSVDNSLIAKIRYNTCTTKKEFVASLYKI